MYQTVVALYDDFQTARQAVEALADAGFDRDNISIIASDSSGEFRRYLDNESALQDDVSAAEGAGFGAVVGALVGLGVALIPGVGPVLAAGPFAAAAMAGIGAAGGAVVGGIVAGLIDAGVPEDEAEYYAEALRRGGALVAITTDESQTSRAQEIMNRYNPIDLDRRVEQWRDMGWTGYDSNAEPYTTDQFHAERELYTTTGMPHDQQHFDIVEEELHVGKREVETGGVRVRSYITSKPVEEQVRLRSERVNIERRPVDRPATEVDIDAFREGTIEVTERHEEPVISKQARVIEEVVISKDVEEHTETVRDTVRRTDVEVEEMSGQRSERATGMAYQPFETYESNWRGDYTSRFGTSGYSWEQYRPAYRYGYHLGMTEPYNTWDWDRMEPEARRQWETRNPDTWDQFKDAVHRAWDDVRGRR